jgi:hypothetical protein
MNDFNPSKDDYIYHYKDYIQHTQWVSEGIYLIINQLLLRMLTHDRTKIEAEELDAYAEIVPGFKNFTYGTQEHKDHGAKLGPAWDHHVQHNKHHPEHFEAGLRGMTLIDLIEMVCDWRAASMRGGTFDYDKSIEQFSNRFYPPKEVVSILRNTCKVLDEKCGEFPTSQKGL